MKRLKFEELFFAQLGMALVKVQRHHDSRGVVFEKVGDLFQEFYQRHLPFTLTGAQKRVIKEIRHDCGKGTQMNRLLQGDVGSGKTIVALLVMLLAADNGFQSCLMAPTEILAIQHYHSLSKLLAQLPVQVRLLTGSVKAAARKKILAELQDGNVQLLVGTHAVIEDTVQFQNLGLAIIDEQHRFGVEQRAALRGKGAGEKHTTPDVLVMTATPIPRTAAMTVYGDLDVSVLDEKPPGRTPIVTRAAIGPEAEEEVWSDVRAQVAAGRQAYVVCPLIEESEKLEVAEPGSWSV